jgi:hypothetical protein
MKKMPTLLFVTLVTSATLTLSASPALADAPLPTPSNLQAMHVSDTDAELDWLTNGASAQDVVERRVNGAWYEYARTGPGFLALTDLTPGTTYTFRVYSIPVTGLGYTTSARTAPLSFSTLSGPDAVAPSKPAAPTFSSITTMSVNVFWPEATDNVRVTGYYLQQLTEGVWSTIRTVTAAQRLQPVAVPTAGASYTFGVIAFDARGNTSARSDPGTVTTLANTAAPTCRVQVIVYNRSFTVDVMLMNTTLAPISGWVIQFTAPPTTTVGNAFNGTLTRTGTAVTVTPAFYYTTLVPGVQATIGFFGTSSEPTVNPPTGFIAAGVPCTPV